MKTQKITKFQRDTLATFAALGYDAFARQNGTVELTLDVPAPKGGRTERQVQFVTERDVNRYVAAGIIPQAVVQ